MSETPSLSSLADPRGLMTREFRCPLCGGGSWGTTDRHGVPHGACHGFRDITEPRPEPCGFTWRRGPDEERFFHPITIAR